MHKIDRNQDYTATVKWEDGSHDYLLWGGILRHPLSCTEASEAIGFAIAHWARLETHIDATILHLNRQEFYPGVSWVDGIHPIRFPDKLAKLKKLFAWHPAINSMHKDIVNICSAMVVMSDTRNILAHSVLEYIDDQPESPEIIFNSFKLKNDGGVSLSVHKISFKALGSFGKHLDDLNYTMACITSDVFSTETLRQLRTLSPRNPQDTR
jgi:hypothetical protein